MDPQHPCFFEKMGSNSAICGASSNLAAVSCNGGVIVGAVGKGKNTDFSEDDDLSSQQSSLTSPTPSNESQIMVLNGHDKHCYSMDQNSPTGQNVIRPEPRSATAQQQQESHSRLQELQHQHNISHPQHFQTSYPHQSSVSGGTTMGRLVVDNEYIVENQFFRAPAALRLPLPLAHPQHSSTGEPESPPTASYGDQGGKTLGRKRSRKCPKSTKKNGEIDMMCSTCNVCGDRAKSFHFGGLSCDSCKAFFRRSVQNDAHMAFRCAYDGCCDINISTRKSCQYCRFKKCLSIGMEKSWVMTEEERNHLNQQRLEKKQNKPAPPHSAKSSTSTTPFPSAARGAGGGIVSEAASEEPKYTFQSSTVPASIESKEPAALAFHDSEYVADVEKMLDYMTYDEQLEIKTTVENYLHSYKELPFRVSFEEGHRDTLEIIEMFTTILRRFAYFSKLNPVFAKLSREDQGNLLRAAVLEMCLLRGAACFDTESNRWPSSTMESLKDCPRLRVEDMKRLVSRELFDMHITFILHMKRLRIDEPIAMLLIMTVLFSPERVPVDDKVKINQAQEKYLMLLKKYVSWKFGQTAGSKIYPQLLTKLSDLRQLNDFHTEFHLNLDRKEVNAIKKSLMELQLNPYQNWKIVPESHQSSPGESSPRAASPVIPAPSPLREMGSVPMVTQALIQSFADRRIPTLLDNPYATFETDLGMIRHVQQTLALFPSSGLSASSAFTSNTIPIGERHPSTESDATSNRNYPHPDPLHGSEKLISTRPSSPSPRGFSSSTDSAEAQALDILQTSSRQKEYHAPSLRPIGETSKATTTSSSSHLESPLLSLLPTEYHSERLHRYLQHRESSDSALEPESVIRAPGFAQTQTSLASSQTVLRKHSSSGPSLPASNTSSVIRSVPARTSSTVPSNPLVRRGGAGESIHFQEPSSSFSSVVQRSSVVTQSFRPIASTTSGGWHGGEVHTTTNGHQANVVSTITTTRVLRPSTFSTSHDEDESH